MSDVLYQKLVFLEKIAHSMGWELHYPHKESMSEMEVERAQGDMRIQQELYARFRSLFSGEIPEWVTKEMRFPLEELWVDSVEERVEFDINWRMEWEKEKLGVHPRYHKDLPALPLQITSGDIPQLISVLKEVQNDFWNRLFVFFGFLNGRYWRCRGEISERLGIFEKEKVAWKMREEELLRVAGEHRLEAERRWLAIERETLVEVKGVSFVLVEVPAGSFMMGALPIDKNARDDEKPYHEVLLSKGLLVSECPCTQELYTSVMRRNSSSFVGLKRPVEMVSWCDALLFCNRLSELKGLEICYELPEGLEAVCANQSFLTDSSVDELSKEVKWNRSANGYRLPTEAEWEYCARGGEEHLYAGSDNIYEVAWHDVNSGSETHFVGEKKANGYGLYDMSGNVWEWVWDSCSREYDTSITDPIYNDTSSDRRVYRGGGWDLDAWYTRVSYRGGDNTSSRSNFVGFRFLRSVP